MLIVKHSALQIGAALISLFKFTASPFVPDVRISWVPMTISLYFPFSVIAHQWRSWFPFPPHPVLSPMMHCFDIIIESMHPIECIFTLQSVLLPNTVSLQDVQPTSDRFLYFEMRWKCHHRNRHLLLYTNMSPIADHDHLALLPWLVRMNPVHQGFS